jgi:hypothetical protein
MVAFSLHGDQLIFQISYICSLLSLDYSVFRYSSETSFSENRAHSSTTDSNDHPLCALSNILITK